MTFLSGFKSYIAAIGLIGLAVYQASVGQWDLMFQSILGAIGLFGIRHAIAKQEPPKVG